jgi:uncharacterized membrane protein (UPF0127 family)
VRRFDVRQLRYGRQPFALALFVVGVLALPASGRAQDAVGACGDAAAPYAEVQIDTYPRLWLELARTPEEKQMGLMFRPEMPWENGMLFVYDRPAIDGYWMRNTLIPLSIAWIERDGTIVDIQDMQPQTDDVHYPAAQYWYALEANQGWFFENGVGVGQQVLFCLGTQV